MDAEARVQRLLRVEQETLRALDAALARVDDATLADELRLFRREHERHVERLAQLLPETATAAVTVSAPLAYEVGLVTGARDPEELLGALAAVERCGAGEYREAVDDPESGGSIRYLSGHAADHGMHAAVLERAAAGAPSGP